MRCLLSLWLKSVDMLADLISSAMLVDLNQKIMGQETMKAISGCIRRFAITASGYTRSISLIPPSGYTRSIYLITPSGYTRSISLITPSGYTRSISLITPSGDRKSVV